MQAYIRNAIVNSLLTNGVSENAIVSAIGAGLDEETTIAIERATYRAQTRAQHQLALLEEQLARAIRTSVNPK